MPRKTTVKTDPADDGFSFRWGIPELDAPGGVFVHGWMLKNYAAAGITRDEFLAVIHISAYHYESPRGKARPSLKTIAHQMGYANRNSLYNLVHSLEVKKLIDVTRIPGKPSEINAHKFARCLIDLEQQRLAALAVKQTPAPKPVPADLPPADLPPASSQPVNDGNGAEPPAPDPEKPAEPVGLDVLRIDATDQGKAMLAEITRYCESKNRRPPIYYASVQQMEAYARVFEVLGDELVKLTTKGLAKERGSRESLLTWLEACARNKARPVAVTAAGQPIRSNALSAVQLARQQREGGTHG